MTEPMGDMRTKILAKSYPQINQLVSGTEHRVTAEFSSPYL
jgi:hypothetical protein